MPELPDRKELDTCGAKPYTYDFARAEQKLKTMDLLRAEAADKRNEEVVNMIDALFSLLEITYSCILRSEMTKLAGNEMVQ